MSLVCVACGAENLESSSSDDVSAICHNCGNPLITAKQNPVRPALPPVKKIAIQDLTIQELIIRTMQFCVCYLTEVAIAFTLLVLCVGEGGDRNILEVVLVLSNPIVSNAAFFSSFWFFRNFAFNLRCLYSLLAGVGLTLMFVLIMRGIRLLFNI